jgi:peptidylprolyl isomerase
VTVHYVGYLYDSTKADGKGAKVESSIDGGIPLTGTVGVGALRSRRLGPGAAGHAAGRQAHRVLPASLAYGTASRDKVTLNGIKYAAIPANRRWCTTSPGQRDQGRDHS